MRISISATPSPAAKTRAIGFNGKTKKVGSKVLQQVISLKPNKWVKVGAVGGYVESLNNIDDDSWVYPNAYVFGNAKVIGSSIRSSMVSGFASVVKSTVQGSKISGESHVTSSVLNLVTILGGAEVTASNLSGKITLMDSVVVYKSSIVSDKPLVLRGQIKVGPRSGT